MFKKIISKAVADKVGHSKVVDSLKESYDYIIVGAGASGNVLADRLSSDVSRPSVLLVEAGGDDAKSPGVHMPASAEDLQRGDFDFRYKTVPQKRACRGLVNQQANIPRGKGLGGSTSINYSIYTRGHREDFDNWSLINGCSGWAFKDVLPYFMLSEANTNQEYIKSGYHGTNGKMFVSDLSRTPLVESFLDGGRELGYTVNDVNGNSQLGFSNMQVNKNKSMRWSTADGYLRPAMKNENLDVSIKSIVNKLLLDANERRVVGINVNKDGQDFVVKCNREVLVAAGAIESPKILMLSGIGPGEHLTKHGIKLRVNLPVGDNFHDHPMCIMEYIVDKPPSVFVDPITKSNRSAKDYMEYLFYTQGEENVLGRQGGLAFVRTRLAEKSSLAPDILVHLSCNLVGETHHRIWNFKENVWEREYKHDKQQHGIYLSSMLLNPKSRGTIRLANTDASSVPLIDPNFLADPNDARVLVEGMKLQMQLGHTESFKRIGATLSKRNKPANSKSDVQYRLNYGQDYLEHYVRSNTLVGNHAAGSCRMGPVSEESSVVDNECRVIGVQGLRVIDASVMPVLPSANTMAATIMIAEKVSDSILGINSVKDIVLPEEECT